MTHYLKTLLLSASLVLSSCSHAGMYPADLKEHVKTFEEKCNCKITIPIYIKPIKHSSAVGVCYGFRQLFIFQFIVLDEQYWEDSDFYDRESLLFHELGHCVYGLDHDNKTYETFLDNYRPKSIMYPYVFNDYKYHRDEYIDELFSKIETSSKEENASSFFSFSEQKCKFHQE